MMITGETYSYSRHQPPLNHISPHLTFPVEWVVLIRGTNNEKRLNYDMEVVIQPLHLTLNGHYAVRRFIPKRSLGLVDLMTVWGLIYIAEKIYNIVRNESTTPSRCFSSSTTRTQCILF